MKVETEYLENRQAKLTVSVDDEQLQQELRAAAGRISKSVNIPGFRRGKAPYQIVSRYVGDDTVFDEALEPLGQAVYKGALEETGLEPYAPGLLDDVDRDPMVLTFTVPLQPEVDLGSYRDVRVSYEPPEVTDKDVEHQIEHLLDDQATLEPVDRAAEWEDVVLVDIKSLVLAKPTKGSKKKTTEPDSPESDNSEFLNRTGIRVLVGKKATYPVPGFPDKVVGLADGESRSFDITLASKGDEIADELKGKTIYFDVTCSQVFKRDIPALDDEFARSVGEYEDLADLRRQLRVQLEKDAEYAARNSFVAKIFDELSARKLVSVSYPPIVVEEQIDDMVKDFERRIRDQQMNLDDYLNLNNMTLDGLRAEFRESAEGQVFRGLILGKLCEVEHITVEDDEVEDEIQTQLLSFGTQAALAKQLFSTPQVKGAIISRRLTDKGIERLTLIARGEAPPIEQGTAVDKSGKPGKKKKVAVKPKRARAAKEKATE